MNEKIANILEQVYELNAAERAELIEALTEVAKAEELDPTYLKEIEERLAAVPTTARCRAWTHMRLPSGIRQRNEFARRVNRGSHF